ncbi:helix-turn-helix domain-containing protein [Pseudorhodoferax sp.]|uniref:helix-turn-helix domain-containing protein n=1 Tax=Pseudorhodoferax sp. TaxID=1993553 RepID=UPI002DD6317D|nr:helix-turn-helix domain-containing protein [Pseudorhodoferax sp.]
MTENSGDSIHQRIAERVASLRAARGLSLDALARHCGVSRSMISLIERGESSPTAVLLERLATGLGVPLATLFDAPVRAADPVARRDAQPLWRDPACGYVRRSVSPSGTGSAIRIVEIDFPPGARVGYDNALPGPPLHQQIWMLEGTMEIQLGQVLHRLAAGDCLAHLLDQPITYHNPGERPARYAVVVAGEAVHGR